MYNKNDINDKLIFFNKNYFKETSGFGGTSTYEWSKILEQKNRLIEFAIYKMDWDIFITWLNDENDHSSDNLNFIDQIPSTADLSGKYA